MYPREMSTESYGFNTNELSKSLNNVIILMYSVFIMNICYGDREAKWLVNVTNKQLKVKINKTNFTILTI